MTTTRFKYVYGPVASRRLGRSLGVDLVPFKTCTYDCVYCQLGHTTNQTIRLDAYVPVEDLLAEVAVKLAGPRLPDFVSLAGSGEPTLHAGIGEVVRGIKRMTSVPVAVITNGSMLWSRRRPIVVDGGGPAAAVSGCRRCRAISTGEPPAPEDRI
jgi:wyosine [tRNA(Phe)-imidazoG37] synthetase (radical SAM superfamily)